MSNQCYQDSLRCEMYLKTLHRTQYSMVVIRLWLPLLGYGVMVALEILALSVHVRIMISQRLVGPSYQLYEKKLPNQREGNGWCIVKICIEYVQVIVSTLNIDEEVAQRGYIGLAYAKDLACSLRHHERWMGNYRSVAQLVQRIWFTPRGSLVRIQSLRQGLIRRR